MDGEPMQKFVGRSFVGMALLGWAALTAIAADKGKKEQGKTEPRGVPLELRFVAKKSNYPLNLRGLSAEGFQQELSEAKKTGKYPAPPAVDLVLELHNTGKKDLTVHVEGDANVVVLDLRGPAAVTVTPLRPATQEFRVPKTVVIPAGKSYKFPAIKSLTYGFRGDAQQAYWTKPGTYTLTASYRTAVFPAPKGANLVDDGFGEVQVTSGPIKIKVTAK
jgi:hypothetical protein